ncbi:MAG: restriction endonuclease subunit S, partial [Clostridium perfringens]|nr:restriction endonuclease subunit S [Clostridium perfringens]
MKSNWNEVKIDDICSIRRGASPRPIQKYISERGIPWVKIADATSSNSRFINETKEFIIEEGKEKSRYIEKGTLILSNSATP